MGRSSRALFGAVFFVWIIWFLSVGVIARQAVQMTAGATAISKEKYKDQDSIGRERHHDYRDSDYHFVIKRRVPNGPNPIHNRRASISRQLPGRT